MQSTQTTTTPPRIAILSSLGLMTPEDLSLALDVNTHTLMTWRREGKGPDFTRLGKAIFYRRDDVLSWIAMQVELVARSGK
jgi:hypothetical protein